MKLIMERFETFSEKTLLQENFKAFDGYSISDGPIDGSGWREIVRPIRKKAYYAAFAAIKKFGTGGETVDNIAGDWYKIYGNSTNIKVWAKRASRATPMKPGDNPNAVLKTFVKNFYAECNSGIPFFKFPRNKDAMRAGIKALINLYKPYILAGIKKQLAYAAKVDEPEQPNIGMPNPNPNPEKKIDKDIQKKINTTKKIIQKYGFLGTRDVGEGAMKLNTMLQKYGAGQVPAISPSTISAVYKFQKAYNKKYPKRDITVDGLFGGQTNRAYKIMLRDAKKAGAKKPDAKKPEPDAEKAKAAEKK